MKQERAIPLVWKKEKSWIQCSTLLLFVTLIVGANLGFSQNCQDQYGLRPDPDKRATKYEKRDNRCEGYYKIKSRDTNKWITVAGFVKGHFIFNTSRTEIIKVSSTVSMDIQIRAVGIPRNEFYRMDATLMASQTLNWPTRDVLSPARLTDKKIGVFGWIGDSDRKTYIPLVVSSREIQSNNDGILRLYLRASLDIKKVGWRVKTKFSERENAYKFPHNERIFHEGAIIEFQIDPNLGNEFKIELTATPLKATKWLKEIVKLKVGSK